MRWIVHAGLPKAASSSIQAMWRDLDDLYYLGKWPTAGQARQVHGPGFQTDADYRMARDTLPNGGLAATRGLAEWVNDVEARAAEQGRDVIALSEECLSGVCFGAGDFTADAGSILLALHTVLGERLRIVFVAREPAAWLRSYYATRVAKGLGSTYAEFVTWCVAAPAATALRGVTYDGLIRVAGQAGLQLDIWLFERFVRDADYRADRHEAAGLPGGAPALRHENAKADDAELEAVRAWNAANWTLTQYPPLPARQALPQHQMRYRRALHAAGLAEEDAAAYSARIADWRHRRAEAVAAQTGPRLDWSLPDGLATQLGDYVRPGNRALAEWTGEDLASWGYAL